MEKNISPITVWFILFLTVLNNNPKAKEGQDRREEKGIEREC
jgi:hypothetical protein